MFTWWMMVSGCYCFQNQNKENDDHVEIGERSHFNAVYELACFAVSDHFRNKPAKSTK